jgi:mycothiol synthase
MMSDQIFIVNSPPIPGLIFRRFRGEADFPGMVAANLASAETDGIETSLTVEWMGWAYQHLKNCDPFRDILIAEFRGEIIGYTHGSWVDEPEGRMYRFSAYLAPAWRRRGIGPVMLDWMENRLRAIAATHPRERTKFFRPDGVSHRKTGTIALLERAGYQPIRYFYKMVRSTLDNIQEFPLLEGLEVRPVLPEHYRALWALSNDNSKDEWGDPEFIVEDYRAWLTHPHFQPELWQVAWDIATDKPIGCVLTFIDHAENEKYNRKRGYSEGLGVERAWQRKGVARALIALSLEAQKAVGMMESALVADRDSVSHVTRLYASCGFQFVFTNIIYRKPL